MKDALSSIYGFVHSKRGGNARANKQAEASNDPDIIKYDQLADGKTPGRSHWGENLKGNVVSAVMKVFLGDERSDDKEAALLADIFRSNAFSDKARMLALKQV